MQVTLDPHLSCSQQVVHCRPGEVDETKRLVLLLSEFIHPLSMVTVAHKVSDLPVGVHRVDCRTILGQCLDRFLDHGLRHVRGVKVTHC